MRSWVGWLAVWGGIGLLGYLTYKRVHQMVSDWQVVEQFMDKINHFSRQRHGRSLKSLVVEAYDLGYSSDEAVNYLKEEYGVDIYSMMKEFIKTEANWLKHLL